MSKPTYFSSLETQFSFSNDEASRKVRGHKDFKTAKEYIRTAWGFGGIKNVVFILEVRLRS